MNLHGLQARARRFASIARARVWPVLHPGISVGKRVRIGRGCRLFLDPGAQLLLGDGCVVDDATTLAVYGTGRIEIGRASFVGHHCTLAAHASIEIGAGTYIAELVSIRDHDHAIGLPPTSGARTTAPVLIGRAAWLGAKVTVVSGARIGEGTVVGANAVVRGDLPPRTVCAGVPARVIRRIDEPEQ